MNRAIAAAPVVALLVVLAACSSSHPDGGRSTSTTSAPSPVPAGGDGRITSAVVPVPDSITGPRFPWWSADGSTLLFSGTPDGSDRVEVLSIAPDGSDPTCLTCDVAPDVDEPLLKPIPFSDGKRVAVRVGDQSPLQAASHAILECRPNVADCATANLVPLVVPDAGDAAVLQDQRELRVAPDGEHIGISQVRRSTDGEPRLVAIVARLRRTDTAYEVDDARVISDRGELKGFTPDGTGALVAEFTPAPFELANPDVVRVDLATGVQQRITFAPDYDEPVELSPDGDWYVVGSGRGSGLFETVSQIRRPSLLGHALDPLTAALFAGHRPELLEGWLVRTGSEADGARGQRIPAPPGGYDGRPIWNWRPDGTAITYWEGRGSGFEPNPTDTRLVVAELVDHEPKQRPPIHPTPDPAWAPKLAAFIPATIEPGPSRDGKDQGSVVVEVEATADGETVTATYRGFSDDGEWIIEGTERAARTGDRTTYTADLRASGDHTGRLQADAVISVGGIDGKITSTVDGRTLTLPSPERPR